jgi:hypothetical protein
MKQGDLTKKNAGYELVMGVGIGIEMLIWWGFHGVIMILWWFKQETWCYNGDTMGIQWDRIRKTQWLLNRKTQDIFWYFHKVLFFWHQLNCNDRDRTWRDWIDGEIAGKHPQMAQHFSFFRLVKYYNWTIFLGIMKRYNEIYEITVGIMCQ